MLDAIHSAWLDPRPLEHTLNFGDPGKDLHEYDHFLQVQYAYDQPW